MAPQTFWFPFDILSSERGKAQQQHPNAPEKPKDFAVIVLNQPLQLRDSIYVRLFENAIEKVAADGGANHLHELNKKRHGAYALELDCIIGDLDSLTPDSRAYWANKNVPIKKDDDVNSTDFTKAVRYIGKAFLDEKDDGECNGSMDIVVLGGLGGRVDQGISTLHHLYKFQKKEGYPHGKMYLLSSECITFLLKPGTHVIQAKVPRMKELGVKLGNNVGILPLNGLAEITTRGLEWNVTDWKTEIGGNISTSNHVENDTVFITTDKDVLFTIDLEFSDPSTPSAKSSTSSKPSEKKDDLDAFDDESEEDFPIGDMSPHLQPRDESTTPPPPLPDASSDAIQLPSLATIMSLQPRLHLGNYTEDKASRSDPGETESSPGGTFGNFVYSGPNSVPTFPPLTNGRPS
jgi:thiamine pyrophosphokinase